MLRLRYAGVVVCAALGCSPVKDTSNVPDAPIDSTDMRPPMIESSNPADMATKVSVIQPISVFFDEQLDPDTVNATTVKLGYDQTIPASLFVPPFFDILKPHGGVPAGMTNVKGTVSYDAAARKVSFVPAAPLPYGYQFVLKFDVKDKGGVTFDGSLTFTTYVNLQTKQYSFNTSTGVPSSSIATPADGGGRQAKRTNTSAPGNDTIWFTADDPRNTHFEFKFDPDGRLLDERNYSSGADGNYDTGDDPVSICVRYAYNAEKQTTERTYANGPGPDTVWCTADDQTVVNTLYQYMGSTMTGWIYNTSPGSDNTWHTSDDRCGYNWEYIYDAQGQKQREILRYCSTDGLPKTADDSFQYYYDYEYNTDGQLTKVTYRVDPGNDTVWLNADDTISSVERWIRDGSGKVTDYYLTYSPGPDNVWGNADDPGTHTTTTYDERGLATETTTYNDLGADGMWGTADDKIASYVTTTYDALGNRIDQKTYNAGTDAMWKTPDDRVIVDVDFDLAH